MVIAQSTFIWSNTRQSWVVRQYVAETLVSGRQYEEMRHHKLDSDHGTFGDSPYAMKLPFTAILMC
jgi:hypothetical protein